MPRMNMWRDLPPVRIKQPIEPQVQKNAPSAQTKKILQEIGDNPIVLNSLKMEEMKLRPLFKDFDPAGVSPNELSKCGKQLYKFGLIDNHTAELMDKAGAEFDKKGMPMNPDVKFNALDFFADRISTMQDNSLRGNPYAKLLLPDYAKAIHVMQNLQAFANSGDSQAYLRALELKKNGGGKVSE